MPKFKSKIDGKRVDAVQFDGTPGGAIKVFETFPELDAKFVPHNSLATGYIEFRFRMYGAVPIKAVKDDWVVKNGEDFDVRKSDVFAGAYEPDDSYPGKGGPWADFLHHRKRMIKGMTAEGSNPGEIARALSMDASQVELILIGIKAGFER